MLKLHILLAGALLIGGPYVVQSEERPAFKYRWIGTNKWAADHGCNVNIPEGYQKDGKNYYEIWGSFHTLQELLPPETYFKEHPEYFALYNKERIPHQLCLSSPQVRKIVADSIIKLIKDDPDLDIITLGLQDNRFFCQCPGCTALDEKDPAPDQIYSRRVLLFYKAVSDRVYKVFPDITIRFGCYDIYAAPPKDKSITLPPNTFPLICHFQEYCNNFPIDHSTCAPNARFRDIIAGWRELADKLFIYEYYHKVNWLGLPWPIVRSIRRDIPWYKENGVVGFYSQYNSDSAASLLNFHVASALLLDVDADVDRLVEEFCKEMFGGAWQEMRAYYSTLEQAIIDSGVCIPGRGFAFPHAVRVFTDGVLTTCNSLVAAGRAKATDSPYRENVQKFCDLMEYTNQCVGFLRLAVEGLGAVRLGVESPRVNKEKARVALQQGKALLDYLKNNHKQFQGVVPWPEKVNPYMQLVLDELSRQLGD